MSTITATIRSVTLLRGPDNQSATRRYIYHLTFDADATTAGDDVSVTAIASTIASTEKNGKTLQLRSAASGSPGYNVASGAAAYASGVAVSGPGVTLAVGGPTAAAALASGCKSMGLIAVLDEAAA